MHAFFLIFSPIKKKMQCLFFFPAVSSWRPTTVKPGSSPPKIHPFMFTLKEWSSIKKTDKKRNKKVFSFVLSMFYLIKKTLTTLEKNRQCHCNYKAILGMWVTNTFSASGTLSRGSQPSSGHSLRAILLTLNMTRMALLLQPQNPHL